MGFSTNCKAGPRMTRNEATKYILEEDDDRQNGSQSR